MTSISDEEIITILKDSKVIAVIGCSSNPEKPSYYVPKFLQRKGYKIIPVNPSSKKIFGENCYKSILDVKEKIDIVEIFRPSEDALKFVEEAITKNPKLIWLQIGIENKEAEELAINKEVKIVMDRCMMIEYKRLMTS